MKKRDVYIMLILIICIAIPMLTMAQGPDDPDDGPIDGGLSILLAAGAAYGAKKYKENKRKQEDVEK
jgi:hypothetical protein